MNIQETYLRLLRQAVLSGKSEEVRGKNILEELPADVVDAVVQLAQRQGTGALVFNELLKLRSLDRSNSDSVLLGDSRSMSEAFYAALKQHCMQNMMEYERLLGLLKKTWDGLDKGGVRPVVLKGFGLASLYPTPYLRNWGDLDIYVGPEQYHQAAEILREVFPHAKHHDEEWEELKHYNFVMPEGLVEMHRTSVKLENPWDNRYFWKLEKEAMKPENLQWVEIEDVKFAIPEAKFNMLFTFFHAWFHFIEEGLGFKQICDVALLVHYTNKRINASSDADKRINDWNAYMQSNLKRLRLWEPWQLMGYICVEALGLPKEEWPLYEENSVRCRVYGVEKHRELFLQRILSEGLIRPKDFGESKDRYEARDKAKKMNFFARKLATLKSRIAGAKEIAPYSPQYARHMVGGILAKGIKRTLTGAKMIDY